MTSCKIIQTFKNTLKSVELVVTYWLVPELLASTRNREERQTESDVTSYRVKVDARRAGALKMGEKFKHKHTNALHGV